MDSKSLKPPDVGTTSHKIHLTLSIGGMTCATCSGAIEKGLKLVDGITEMFVMCLPLQHL